MTDTRTFAHVLLRGSSATVSMETSKRDELPAPLGNGTTEIDECADLNGDGQVDRVTHIVNKKSETTRDVTYASEFHQEAPTLHNHVLKDTEGSGHHYVDRYKLFSPHTGQLQARFESEKKAAENVFKEFKAALSEGRVVSSTLWDTEFTVRNAAGKELFRVDRIHRANGKILRVSLRTEANMTITIEDSRLLAPIQKRIDALYTRQTASQDHQNTGRLHHKANHRGGKHVASR